MHGRGVGGDAEDCLPSCLANVAWQDDEVAKALDAWANSKDQCDDALMMPCLYPACMQNVPFKFQDQRVQQRYLKCSMEGIMKKKDSEWQERVELAQEEARAASGEGSIQWTVRCNRYWSASAPIAGNIGWTLMIACR